LSCRNWRKLGRFFIVTCAMPAFSETQFYLISIEEPFWIFNQNRGGSTKRF
jgi:hypothetical protein